MGILCRAHEGPCTSPKFLSRCNREIKRQGASHFCRNIVDASACRCPCVYHSVAKRYFFRAISSAVEKNSCHRKLLWETARGTLVLCFKKRIYRSGERFEMEKQ